MIVGKVVGSIVSTRKSEKLIGNKFMIVEPVHHMKAEHSQIVGTRKRSKNWLRRRNSTGRCRNRRNRR